MTAGPRDRLIDSAIALIRERGVHATGLADLLEHSGTARASVYQHFAGGKSGLVEEATRVAGLRMDEFLATLLGSRDPVGALRSLVRWWRTTLRETDFAVGCPVVAAALAGADTPSAREAAAQAFATWERRLARAFAAGGLDGESARSLAGFVVSALEGAIVQARATRSVRPLDDAERQLTWLVGGYLTPPAT
ncbi:TetR family transcriptional regulator [Prauserella shujinwangii]|uniref:TetR family transcriptional regulator n=1 Tax=Prauserella shujinwangii TaxID=1453103 RepID=A0A2T0LQ29_9PSEU|nr:TetR/AcrR family transcriptional regulator [Prauserella shujinwangii]PRX45431.1 TetR family transcriptional regulator [Prauserella shujinwangii]